MRRAASLINHRKGVEYSTLDGETKRDETRGQASFTAYTKYECDICMKN